MPFLLACPLFFSTIGLFSFLLSGLFLHFYDYLVLAFLAWDDGAWDSLAINGYLLDALLLTFWVLYHDVVFATAELAGYLVLMGGAWQTWVDVQTLVIWLDA